MACLEDSGLNYDAIIWIAALLVASITFTVYLPALQNDFVNWDDDQYVYENQNIQTLNGKFFKWFSTSEVNSNWHPLTVLSHALDYAVWGLNPYGHHLTSIIFHTLNTLLVFFLTCKIFQIFHGLSPIERDKQNLTVCLAIDDQRRLGKKTIITAGITALFFGIHPLHVESVAWVSERKDVLYSFFFLLSLLAYLKYVYSIHSTRWILYSICLIFFILSLLSKPMAVSLPVVLLILDFFPLRRLPTKEKIQAGSTVLIEKIPFFLLSVILSLITVWAQRLGGALKTMDAYPLMERILVAMRALIFYLLKMLLPFNLAPFYPYPANINFLIFEYTISCILLVVITLFCIKSLKRDKVFSVIWFYYIVTLLPVLGIVKSGGFAMADRYTYLSSLGPFLLAGIGVGYVFEKYLKKQYVAIITAVIITISGTLVIKTVKQISIWKDSISLWSYELKLYPDTIDIVYNNRGNAYNYFGNHKKAIADYNKAIEINSQDATSYYNRGDAYSSLGDYQNAIADYTRAITLNPKEAKVYNNRGNMYKNLTNYREAIADYNKAIEINPQYADAYNNRGAVYASVGNYQEAIADFNKALTLNPRHVAASNNLDKVYSLLGR